MQVTYPVSSDTKFDYDYYMETHLSIIRKIWGKYIKNLIIVKGESGGGNKPSPYYIIATIIFETQHDMDRAFSEGKPIWMDVPNYTNVKPNMMIGNIIT